MTDFELTQSLQGLHDLYGRKLELLLVVALGRSLAFGTLATVLTWGVAIALGSVFPVLPNWARKTVLWTQDFLLAFPTLLLSLAIAAIRGPSYSTLLLALSIGTLPSLLRMAATHADELSANEFALAARSLGATRIHLVLRHFLPGVSRFAAVQLPNTLVHTILAEAALSFLGVGAPIGADTLGSLLHQGREYLIEAPQISIATALPLLTCVLLLGFVSDTLSKRPQKRVL